MLLPIGQEHETQRMPWVSAAIIVILVFVYLIFGMGGVSARRIDALDDRLLTLNEFLVDHPYLDLPPELGSLGGAELVERAKLAKKRYLAETALPEASLLVSEQARLAEQIDGLKSLTRDLPGHEWGFVPARPRLLDAFTSIFMHGGLWHLLGNVLFFFVVGPYLEDVWGRILFGVVFLTSGLVAVFAHMLRFPDSHVPLIGASGAIAGIMGAFLVRLFKSRIKFAFLPFFALVPVFLWLPRAFLPLLLIVLWLALKVRFTFLAPAFIVLPIWFIEQLAEAHDGRGTGVAYWAHIGGFCFGAAVAFAVRLTHVEEKLIRPGLDARPDFSGTIPIPKAGGKPPVWPPPLEDALKRNDIGEALRFAENLLGAYAGRDEEARGLLLIRELKRRMPNGWTPRWILAAAGFLERHGEPRVALEYYSRLMKEFPEDPSILRALLRSGEISKKIGELDAARVTFEAARQHPDCPPATRSYLEQELTDLASRRR